MYTKRSHYILYKSNTIIGNILIQHVLKLEKSVVALLQKVTSKSLREIRVFLRYHRYFYLLRYADSV